MDLPQINDTVTVDDLVRSYLRYKDWMGYDVEHSAYCAMDIIVMQALFGTAYIKVPAHLVAASYEQLLAAMEERRVTMRRYIDAVHEFADESDTNDILMELEKTSFKSEVHYFTTLFEVVRQAAASAHQVEEDDPKSIVIDESIIEDHFEEMDEASFESIKAFIVGEHPKVEFMSFPTERLHRMGLPRTAPADPHEQATAPSGG